MTRFVPHASEMLSLQTSLSNGPSASCHFLLSSSVLLYYDADTILVLDPSSLQLRKVLVFMDVFPAHLGSIHYLATDSAMNLVFAASQHRVAVWVLSQLSGNISARVHSSLELPPSLTVSTLRSASGLLAVGYDEGLAVHTLILENDLPTWSQKWSVDDIPTPSLIAFSPSLEYISAISKQDTALRIYSTTTGVLSQSISHPRPIIEISWRHSHQSSRGDLILYTITSDTTLRIFMPVLDDPTYLQLHAAISLPFPSPCEMPSPPVASISSIFWLERTIISSSLAKRLAERGQDNESQRKKIEDMLEQGWDIFFRVMVDGSIIATAVANIDRRPPTLLDCFTLEHTPPGIIKLDPSHPTVPTHLYVAPRISTAPQKSGSVILVTCNPLTSYSLDLVDLIFPDDRVTQSRGLNLLKQMVYDPEHQDEHLSHNDHDVRLARTPEGRGISVLRNPGTGGANVEILAFDARGKFSLSRTATKNDVDMVVVLDKGQSFATYVHASSTLTFYCSHSSSSPTPPPSHVVQLPEMVSLFSMPSDSYSATLSVTHDHATEYIVGTTSDHKICLLNVHCHSSPSCDCFLTLHSTSTLPQPEITMTLPVDPMAWSFPSSVSHTASTLDILLSVSNDGELMFWRPQRSGDSEGVKWLCTGKVKTGKTGIKMARCSSAKKSVLVVPEADGGEEMTIWDSHESAFSSGLEFTSTFSASTPINDLDWSATPDGQSVLAVGFKQHVDILCQQRMTYFDEGSGWAVYWRVEIGSITPLEINDSIWLADGSLLVAAGKQLFLFGQRPLEDDAEGEASLFEHVARHNGPLQDWHPQMLLQCLLWGKIELVKEIILKLAQAMESKTPFEPLDTEKFLEADTPRNNQKPAKKRYSLLFSGPEQKDEDEEAFSRQRIKDLIESLQADPLPYLTPNEQAHLQVLIQATLEIDEQRRSLDANGLRYLISMRSFYILNRRAETSVNTPATIAPGGGIPRKTGKRERLRYRDMIWAFHSESQEILLNAATSACNGKMLWSDARALGVAVWLKSIETMKIQLESIARNEYMAGDNRDPTACSLFYFALGKVKLVHGLWRQAAWHKEQPLMLKFLANDFSEPRWRTAALKNAFALLGKRRFEYAAAFFLLGGSLKDAVNVCIKNVGDFQLAVVLARIVEQGDEGPILRDVLNNAVLPTAFKSGNRWLASWAFWLLHRRDLAVRVLLTPLNDIVNSLDVGVTEVLESTFDDTSLALLFSQLRSKTLQAAKGASEISGAAEWNFVLQTARIFCRMGCHVLALDLVRSWTFELPTPLPVTQPDGASSGNTSPLLPRPPVFGMRSHMRRRSSIVIDMEIPSLPPSRSETPDTSLHTRHPTTTIPEEPTQAKESEAQARTTKLGTLMKSAKQDVQVPEFDMGAFM